METPPREDIEALVARRQAVASWIQDSLKPATRLIEEGVLEDLDEEIVEEAEHFEVRDYQLDAWASLWGARQAGEKSGLIHLATGLGKTSVGVMDVKKFREEHTAKYGYEPSILFACGQNDILDQAAERFAAFIPEASQGFYAGKSKERHGEITFATMQSLYNDLDKFEPDTFDYIVYDEAHHAKADTFEAVVKHFKPEFQLALTATPDRLDELNIRELFGEELYSKGLAQALAEGLLAEPDYHIVFDDAVKKAMESDFDPETLKELNELLSVAPRNETIAQNVKDEMERIGLEFGSDKTIVFCRDIAHAEEMAKLLGGKAYHSGITNKKKRKAILDEFKHGDLSVICTRDMFNEGIDIPDARLVVFLRSTSSQTVFEQQLGRGLRKHAGKDQVSVLDFVANVERIAMIRELANRIGDYTQRQQYGSGEGNIYDRTAEGVGGSSFQVHTGHGDFGFDRLSIDLLTKFEALRQDNAPEPPEDCFSFSAAAKETNVDRSTIVKLIEDMGWELPVYKFHTRIGRGISQQQLQQLREEYPDVFVEEASEEYFSFNSASQSFDVSPKVLERLVKEKGWNLPTKKFGPQSVKAISTSQIEELKEYSPDSFAPRVSEDEFSIGQVADALEVDHYTIKRIIDGFGWELPRKRFRNGMVSGTINASQVSAIQQHPNISGRAEEVGSVISIQALSKELQSAQSTIEELAESLEIKIKERRFGKSRTRGYGVTAEEAQIIRNKVVPKIGEDEMRVTDAARTLGIYYQTLNKLADELGIEPVQRRGGRGRKVLVFNTQQLQTIEGSERYKDAKSKKHWTQRQ